MRKRLLDPFFLITLLLVCCLVKKKKKKKKRKFNGRQMPPAIEVSTFCNCHWRFIVTNSNNFKRERYTVRLKLQIKQRTKTITI